MRMDTSLLMEVETCCCCCVLSERVGECGREIGAVVVVEIKPLVMVWAKPVRGAEKEEKPMRAVGLA